MWTSGWTSRVHRTAGESVSVLFDTIGTAPTARTRSGCVPTGPVTQRTSGSRSGCAWPAPANHDTVATATRGATICKPALDAFGRVDILVNDAGVLRDKAFHKMDPHMIDSVIGVHLNGALFVSQRVPRLMPAARSWTATNSSMWVRKVLRWQRRRLMLTSGQHAGLTVQWALQGGQSRMSFRAATPVAGPPAGGK